jgi:adenylate cyclase
MRKRYIPYLVGVLALAAVLALRLLDPLPVQQIRLWAFDGYQRLEPRPFKPAGVRIVDIDEESLKRIGQWPWPRTTMAELVTNLTKMGALSIGMDIVFAEPDRTKPERLIASWKPFGLDPATKAALRELPNPDKVYAKAIARGPVVTGFAPRASKSERMPVRSAGFAYSGDKPNPAIPNFAGATTNLPSLAKAAKGNGSFGILNDFDSIVRRVPLVQQVGGRIYPSLAAETLRVAQGASTHIVKSSTGSGEGNFTGDVAMTAMKIGRLTVPTAGDGTVLIHDTGNVPERLMPAHKVLNAEKHPGLVRKIKNHIVLIGTSAKGLRDIRATPITRAAPGVTLHAQALEQIIHGDYLKRPDWSEGAEVLFFVLLGLILVLVLPRVGAFWCGVIGLGAISGALGASWLAFDRFGWLLDPVYPALSAFAVYLPTSATLFVMSEGEKRFIRAAFSRYLSPALVERLAQNPETLNLGGENRELTVMFSDIRGFTPVAETMTPEQLTRFMNRFLTPMTETILSHSGYIDKYMGDAIMAFWNAPVPTGSHPARACHAALTMRRSLVELNRQWTQEFAQQGQTFPGVAIGIGMHTGVCCVGNMGSEQRFDYSALGDNVNLGSRLEGQSKTYGVDAVLSEATRAEAAGSFAFLELDLIRVKGRAEPVRIHTLVGTFDLEDDADYAAFAQDHAAMIAAYRRQDWDTAAAACQRCADAVAAGPAWLPEGVTLAGIYALYAERIADLRANPPGPDWGAVYTAETK